ncbi:serine protease [Streptomyces sp. NPDC013740]|uniref:serine protease n=1 Tax=Streptomyces sp. NPDC013740 TaxID=3364867 RepID=UPI0036F705A7
MNNPATNRTTRRTLLRGLTLAAAGACLPTAVAHAAAPTAPAPASDDTETYAVTLTHLGRDGAPTTAYFTHLVGVSGAAAAVKEAFQDGAASVTLRVPRGRYLLDSQITTYAAEPETDWLVQPRLDVDGDTTVVLDARLAAPVDIRPPEAGAEHRLGGVFVEVEHEGGTAFANVVKANRHLRVGHLGPAAEPGSVRQWIDTFWKGERQGYALGYTFTSDRALTGLVRHPAPAELGTLTVRAVAPDSGAGYGSLDLMPTGPSAVSLPHPFRVPGATTFLMTPERGSWDLLYTAPVASDEATPNRYSASGVSVRAGATTTVTFDGPAFGPALDPAPGARPAGLRSGNTLSLALALLADGEGHLPSAPPYEGATTTLHRNGALVGTRRGAPGHAEFTVPPARADYRLSTTAARPGGRVTAAWTFTSCASSRPVELPLSVVRFVPAGPAPGPDGTLPPGTTSLVQVTVQGAAAASGIRSLAVSVSTDAGATWSRVPVVAGRAAVRTPGPGGTVSLRTELTDTAGNTLTQTQIGAYRVAAA